LRQDLNTLKNDIVEVGKRTFVKGYVASNDGNISARLEDDQYLITPTGVSKGFMKPEDLIIINSAGKVLDGKGKPSTEILLHLRIYKERQDVNSVCHVHPPYATGFAVAGIPLDKFVLPEVVITLGTIPLVEYGEPGTEDLYKPLLPIIKDYDAFLLSNHGAVTIGRDIFNAYYKMETLEHFAQIAFIAHQLGNLNTLNKDQVQKLMDQREKFGIRKNIGIVPAKEKSIRKKS
jgi:L-fuculose-phosphate aldolase